MEAIGLERQMTILSLTRPLKEIEANRKQIKREFADVLVEITE